VYIRFKATRGALSDDQADMALDSITVQRVSVSPPPAPPPPMTYFKDSFDDEVLGTCWTNGGEYVTSGSILEGYQFPWSTGNGPTPTPTTGPTGAHHGSKYLYMESNGRNVGDIFLLVLDCPIDARGASNARMTFSYHMFGNSVGSLNVDLYYLNVWHDGVFRREGQQHLESAYPWTRGFVELPLFGEIYIRFRGVKGTNGDTGDVNSDIAIDAVVVSMNTPDC
jgi:hypothetical protein